MNDGPQMLFNFARPDNVIITNIGMNERPLSIAPRNDGNTG